MARRTGGYGPRRHTARHSSAWPRPVVLVADDEPHIIDLLQLGFGYEGFDVSVATTTNAALRAARARRPDLIVIDVGLGDRSGIELMRLLRAESADAAIVLLGAASPADGETRGHEDGCEDGCEDECVAGLELGADDYVTKPFTFRELMARVRSVMQRRGKSVAGRLTFEDVILDRERHLVTRDERPIELTLREFELLDLFLRHPEQVLSRATILTQIWGGSFTGSENVLDVYIHLLRAKLGDKPPRLIRTVRGIGYVLRASSRQPRWV